MSFPKTRSLTRFRLIIVLALFCCGTIVLAVSHKVLPVSASKGSDVSGANNASISSVLAAPASVSVSSLRGTLSLNGNDQIDEFTISTYNLQANLETVVRHPRQNGRVSESRPRLSPDGKKIVYTETGPDGYNDDVYVMNADGSNPVNLSNYPSDPDEIYNCRFTQPNASHGNSERCRDTWAAWSPDGKHIAFISGRNGRDELYVMDADGTNLTLLPSRLSSAPNNEAGTYGQPSWSPDGSKIAYSYPTEYYTSGSSSYPRQSDIAVLSLDRDAGGNFVVTSDMQLTSHSNLFDLAPAWSPDGSNIAFYRYSIFGNSASLDVYVMGADGSNQVNLTNTTDRFEYLPVWSPDGSKIAFTSEIPDPERTYGRVFFNPTQLIVLDLNSSSEIQVPTRAPRDIPYSWIDPCTAPESVAEKHTNVSRHDQMMLAHASPSRPAISTSEEPNTPKCVKEIIVNNTTDDEDYKTTDEFCDTNKVKPGNQCSLRAAIQEANAREGVDFINFDIPGTGGHTIAPKSPLPPISQPVIINGATQPGYTDGSPKIFLSGVQDSSPESIGLSFISGSGASTLNNLGSMVEGLAINGWGTAINFSDSRESAVQSCHIGFGLGGSVPTDASNSSGILIVDSDGVRIGGEVSLQGNVISNSDVFGISVNNSRGCVIQNNKIGTSIDGTQPVKNDYGISLGYQGVTKTQVVENLISGNRLYGIAIFDSHSSGVNNRIANNLIGTKADGKSALGNGKYGIWINDSTNNVIEGNTISGHNLTPVGEFAAGIALDVKAESNKIYGNKIGVGIDGTSPIPNLIGIHVTGASRNHIGVSEQPRNNISGNTLAGIFVAHGLSTDRSSNTPMENRITNNDIGVSAGNQDGILLGYGELNEISNNTISGNSRYGIRLNASLTNSEKANFVHDNLIGSGAANRVGIGILGDFNKVYKNTISNNTDYNVLIGFQLGLEPNVGHGGSVSNNEIYDNLIEGDNIGIGIIENARNNMIGGNGIGNKIYGHRSGAGIGILLGATSSEDEADFPSGNKFYGNIVGEAQRISFSNRVGMLIHKAKGNFIGNTAEGLGNLFTSNEEDGIKISGEKTKGNEIAGNFIGFDPARPDDPSAGNRRNGIYAVLSRQSIQNTILFNRIGHNGANGISVFDSSSETSGEFTLTIAANQIGVARTAVGLIKIPNMRSGIKLEESRDVLIGGKVLLTAKNVIAANNGDGITLTNSYSNRINQSIIGTDESETPEIGNVGDGIGIYGGDFNLIGGDSFEFGNTIAQNEGNGVYVQSSSDNKIRGNLIGVAQVNNRLSKHYNAKNGIEIFGGEDNEIGRSGLLTPGNVIGGNLQSGIALRGVNTDGTKITGNYIGTDADRTNLGNRLHGVFITGGARNTNIGGKAVDSGNTIAFNGTQPLPGGIGFGNTPGGVRLDNTAGEGNLVDPNTIFGNAGLGIDIGAPGTTPNDFGDADVGPNRLQNYPEIISRHLNSKNEFIITYRVTSAPGNSNYGTDGIYVEFFRTDAQGEGEKFLGADHYTVADYADGAANPREVNLGNINTLGINPNDRLTASATDASGNTSEFFGDTGGLLAGSVQFSASSYKVSEGAGTLEVTVTRTGPASGPVIASYIITPGTATAGTDYTNATGSVTFADGDLAPKTFNVQITNDSIQEAEESFKLTLIVTSGSAALGTPFESTITITDDEVVAPTLDALSNLTINEDSPLQTINLSGISAGGAASQALSVTATSSDTNLIPNPSVSYSSPNNTGSLNFTPVANQSGTALITVTVTNVNGAVQSGINSITRTFTVTVNAVNDAPINTVPGAQTTTRNTALVFSAANANLISIADIDVAAGLVQITLTVTNGTLSLSSTVGLVFTTGDGTADATMTFTGALVSINAAISGLTFTPTSNYTGAASIQITSNDQGNTGSGGALSDTDTINITVLEPTLQFSSATFTVGEAQNHATVTVTRTGSNAQPASVGYATSDLSGLTNCNVMTGNASARCDYTAVGGTLYFTAGQSSLSFTIPIINDVYVEGPETLSVTLSTPVEAVLGNQSTTTVTITDNDNQAGAANPVGDAAFFIRQQYMDFLNREPEAQGLADWLKIINDCPPADQSCDFVQVSSGFFRSPEYFDRGYYIYRFYEVGLGRKPTYDEYQRDLRLVTGFLTNAELEQRKQQFALDFTQRQEFKALYDQYDSQTRSQEYVDALAQTAGVTLANRQQLASELANSIKQRWDVLRAIVQGPEVSQKFFNKAFVVVGYFAYLRRDPDALYLDWISKMDNPPSNRTYQDIYREMIRGFVESQEYRHRFGQ